MPRCSLSRVTAVSARFTRKLWSARCGRASDGGRRRYCRRLVPRHVRARWRRRLNCAAPHARKSRRGREARNRDPGRWWAAAAAAARRQRHPDRRRGLPHVRDPRRLRARRPVLSRLSTAAALRVPPSYLSLIILKVSIFHARDATNIQTLCQRKVIQSLSVKKKVTGVSRVTFTACPATSVTEGLLFG